MTPSAVNLQPISNLHWPLSTNQFVLLHKGLYSVPRVLRYPSGIARGGKVISGFGRHIGLTDIIGLDLMPCNDPMPDEMNLDYLKLLYCEF